MVNNGFFARWDNFPEVEYIPGIRRRTVTGEKVTVTHVKYSSDAVIPDHSHESEQVTIITRGRLVIKVEGIEREVGPGDVVVIPSNAVHSLRAVDSEGAEFYEAFHPIRLDYLIGFVGRDIRDNLDMKG